MILCGIYCGFLRVTYADDLRRSAIPMGAQVYLSQRLFWICPENDRRVEPNATANCCSRSSPAAEPHFIIIHGWLNKLYFTA